MAKYYTEHDRSVPKTPDEAFKSPGFFPVVPAMLSVADPESGVPNIMPLIGWGFLNRLPMIIGVAICVEEYNNDYYVRGTGNLLRRTMDFVLNIPTTELRDHITKTGRLSRGKDPSVDKFKETGLTPGPGRRVKSPHIVECPVNLECVVRGITNLGSHDLYLGEVVGCYTDGEVIKSETLQGFDKFKMKLDDGRIETLTWETLIERKYE